MSDLQTLCRQAWHMDPDAIHELAREEYERHKNGNESIHAALGRLEGSAALARNAHE